MTGARPHDELVLLACGTEARRRASRERMAELARSVAEEDLFEALVYQRVLAVAGRRIDALGAAGPSFGRRLREALEPDRQLGVVGATLADLVLDVLAGRGIRALPLKGTALAESVHGDASMRRSVDIDVLVAPDALSEAAEALRALGYAPDAMNGLPDLHLCVRHDANAPRVELHWRVHWIETSFSAEMLAQATPAAGGRLAPRPEHELGALLLFLARDGFVGVRLLADVAAWWDRRAGDLPPGGLDGLAQRHPELRRAFTAALAVCERLVGVPAREALPSFRPDRRVELAVRLANWDARGDDDAIAANRSLVDGLLTPEGELGDFARRNVILAPRVVDEWYQLPPGALGRRRVLRALHPAKMLARYGLAIATLRVRGTWSPVPASSGS